MQAQFGIRAALTGGILRQRRHPRPGRSPERNNFNLVERPDRGTDHQA